MNIYIDKEQLKKILLNYLGLSMQNTLGNFLISISSINETGYRGGYNTIAITVAYDININGIVMRAEETIYENQLKEILKEFFSSSGYTVITMTSEGSNDYGYNIILGINVTVKKENQLELKRQL